MSFVLVFKQVVILLSNHCDGNDEIAIPFLDPRSERLSLQAGGIILKPVGCCATRVRMLATFEVELEAPTWFLDFVAGTICQTSVLRWQTVAQQLPSCDSSDISDSFQFSSHGSNEFYRWLAGRCQRRSG